MSSTKKAATAADPDKIPLAKAIKRAAKPKAKKPRMSASAARAEGAQRTKLALAVKATVDANPKAIAAADQENAKKRDERGASPDGLAASERAMASRKTPPKPDVTDRAIANADGPGPLSMLDAAAIVLRDGGEWRSKSLVDEMSARGLWTSPNGKTPEATLYASMTREILRRPDARFRIAGRGLFAASKAVAR